MPNSYLKYLLLSALGGTLLNACGATSNDRYDLVLRDVSVFNSETGTVLRDQSIFIDEGLIVAITPVTPSDSAVEIIEGEDRLVAPGLIDTHIHSRHHFNANRDLTQSDWTQLSRAYLDYGVTTVAEMGQPPEWVETFSDWEANPVPTRPDFILVAGSIGSVHDWDRRPPPHHILVRSPEDARAQVRRYHEQGAKRIKLYWKLERPDLQAAVDEAEMLGIRPFAHIDNGFTSIQNSLDDEVRHFEHFFTLNRSVTDPDTLIEMIQAETNFVGQAGVDEWTLSLSLYHDMIERTPELRLIFDDLLDRLAAEGASVSTALNILAANAGQSDVYSGFDPYPPRLQPEIREGFVSKEYADRAFGSVMTQVRRAHERGVMLRIGTDASNGGAATLAELRLLAEADIPVADVLRIATWNGATVLNIDDTAGTIRVGRAADLVIFEQDPFLDPAYFQSGVTTVKSGQLHRPQVSAVDTVLDIYETDGNDAAKTWLASQVDPDMHPSDIANPTIRALNDGDIDIARFLIDVLPASLRGERVADYLRDRTLINIAARHAETGNLEMASDVLDLAVRYHPESARVFNALGQLKVGIDDTDAAVVAFERALVLDPENETVRAALEALQSD